MKEEDKYVGHRFLLQRKQLKLTQPEVGELCGVTGKTIGFWEKGSPIPSNQLTVLFENDFDIYFILTGGELQSELMIYPETDEVTNKPLDSISCDNSHPDNSSFTKSDASPLEASPTGAIKEELVKPSENLSIDELAELGKRFFDAWSNVFHTHGTEMQSAIMSALKGAEIAHMMVSEQFKEEKKPHKKRKATSTLTDESKKK